MIGIHPSALRGARAYIANLETGDRTMNTKHEIPPDWRLTMKNAVESAIKALYVQYPNDIHGLPGSGWYPKCGGVHYWPMGEVRIEPPVSSPRIPQDNWPVAVYVNTWGGGIALMRRFETWDLYMNFARQHGGLSELGRNHI